MLKQLTVIVFTVCSLYLIFQIAVLLEYDIQSELLLETGKVDSVILWWTSGDFYPDDYVQRCGNLKCLITHNRNYFKYCMVNVLIFYGSDFKKWDLPLPRYPKHKWVLFHEESMKNQLLFLFEENLQIFNYSSTFSRYSDFPLLIDENASLKNMKSLKYFVKTSEKNRLIRVRKLAPVLYIQSICSTTSGRDDYVTELMKYIPIDSYGECLNNKQLPINLISDYLNTISSDEFYHFIARYKFIIAYENSVCDDYLTEKFWRGFHTGVVPIYYGAPNFKDRIPNERSVISVREFENPRQLADFILKVNASDELYESYLDHKLHQMVSNRNLLHAFNYHKHLNFTEFECKVCSALGANQHHRFINKKHYNCDKELKFPNMDFEPSGSQDWRGFIEFAKIETDVFQDFIRKNKNFSRSDWEQAIDKRTNPNYYKVNNDQNEGFE